MKKININDFTNKNLNSEYTGYILFYADWCGHCKTLKPIWDKLVKDSNFMVAGVDCTSSDVSEIAVQMFGVKGFPSVHWWKNGLYMGEYSGNRNLESYKKFATENFNVVEEVKKDNMWWYILLSLFILLIIGIIITLKFWKFK